MGAPTLFADTTSGGTWSSSDTLIATIGADGVATGMSPGTVTITYSIDTVYVTKTVQVYPAEKVQVDISVLPTGVYLVKVNGTEVRKFVKR